VPEMFGSITGMKRRPTRWVNAARATAKFPEEDSITVVASQISPRSAARFRIQKAARSLMLPTGFTYSSLAYRFMALTARGTCGVGRRVLRSCCRRATRLDAGCGFGRTAGPPGTAWTLAGGLIVAAPDRTR